MTVIEQKIIDTISAEFIKNKENWDEVTKNEQINTRWVKWVSLHLIADKIGITVYEASNMLSSMKVKGLVEAKLQINKQFFACQIEGYKQHKEKDYYFQTNQ